MAVTRQIIFGISPKEGLAQTFSFVQAPDSNSSSKAFTCAIVPKTRGAGVNLLQETVFLGTTSAAGVTLQAFKRGVAKDGIHTVTASAVSHRLDPDVREDRRSRSHTTKRYRRIYFHGDNPRAAGREIYYTKDTDPLTDPMTTWTAFEGDADKSFNEFSSGIAEYIHIKMVDETDVIDSEALCEFSLEYYSTAPREGINS